MDIEAQKRQAAALAVEWVRPGMRLGLGTGSTARHFVALLAERVRAGLDVVGVATSEATRVDAERFGVPLTTLDETPELDLTVDGADEIAPDLSLIKGGGGALLREKIVAASSARMVVIADESKWVIALGRYPLPIEVVPFGLAATRRAVEAAVRHCPAKPCGRTRRPLRHGRRALVGRHAERIADARMLAERLSPIPRGEAIPVHWDGVYRPATAGIRVIEFVISIKPNDIPPIRPVWQPTLAWASPRRQRRCQSCY
jgi:ribose 5-phosphate isomerase A